MFPTENEPERSCLLQISQNILPSLFITWCWRHEKLSFHDRLNALFFLLLSNFLLFFLSSFTGLLPFSLAALLFNLTEIAPSSLQFNHLVWGDVQGVVRWVGRELESTFTSTRRVWVPVIFAIDTRDQEWRHRIVLLYFLYSWHPCNLKFSVLFNNYDFKTNQINVNSFNSSTSPQAIEHDILLIQPYFY